MPEHRNRPAGNGAAPKVDAWQQDQAQSSRRTPTEPAHSGPDLLDHLADLEEGRRRRDEGTARAAAGAHLGWKAYAERQLAELIAEGKPFTSDDLRDRTGEPLGTSPMVFGALIRAASMRDEIAPVGYATSRRPEAHARPVRLWRAVGR